MSIGLAPPSHIGAPERALDAGEPAAVRGGGLWADAWRRLRRNRAAILSGLFLLVIGALAAAAPWIPGLASPELQDLKRGATFPSSLIRFLPSSSCEVHGQKPDPERS